MVSLRASNVPHGEMCASPPVCERCTWKYVKMKWNRKTTMEWRDTETSLVDLGARRSLALDQIGTRRKRNSLHLWRESKSCMHVVVNRGTNRSRWAITQTCIGKYGKPHGDFVLLLLLHRIFLGKLFIYHFHVAAAVAVHWLVCVCVRAAIPFQCGEKNKRFIYSVNL